MSSLAVRAGVLNAVALSLMAAVGALTLLLAVPRLAEGLLSLSGNAAFDALDTGGTYDDVDAVIASRDRTVGWLDRGKHHAQLSWALMTKAQALPPEAGGPLFERAVAEAERAIAQAPAYGFAWHQLAHVLMARDGPSQRVADAELSSIAVGPYENELVLPRLDILFAVRSYIDQRYDDVIDSQARVAWKREIGRAHV